MIQIIAYKCSHCGEIIESEHACRIHEERCDYNPKFENCVSCRHHNEHGWLMAGSHMCMIEDIDLEDLETTLSNCKRWEIKLDEQDNDVD